MILQGDGDDTDMQLEMLRHKVLVQKARAATLPWRSDSTVETKLLVAMQLNLEIVKTNRSIDSLPGVTNDYLDGPIQR